MLKIDWASWIIAISALASAIILFFYTLYTYRMQKAVEKQSEELVHQKRLGIIPLLILKLENTDILKIKNVGNGTAINVKIKSSKVKKRDIDNKPEITFEETFMIKADEEIKIPVNGMLISDSISFNDIGLLRFGNISFQDIEGNVYEEDLKECVEKEIKFSFPKLIEKK